MANASYSVCFTPGQDCEGLIAREIGQAKDSILLQAYSFTSAPIAKALMEAKQRGVDVRVILDKSQRTEKYTGATFLKNVGIPVVIDEQPAIAHSKVLVVDQQTVLTGSFNFTRSAQRRNAENLIVIKGDPNLARAYAENWNTRWNASVAY
ncbi:phospholipase D family nuclease [Ralstonia wenshanensis]|uniref:phospholipase D family nuclease n=1 Tax=Ralstonia wenshanensis TaxID=2842456 RepID=UPI002AADAB82|nr:phospholipase D family protein [Ralstonia wenshanensis]MDY7508808.1 phospholipase D family protein [Ralstonia wenshanensis]